MYLFLSSHIRTSEIADGAVSYVAFLFLQSDFNGLPVGTYQAFPNIHPPQIPATPPSYESVSAWAFYKQQERESQEERAK